VLSWAIALRQNLPARPRSLTVP